MSDSQPSLFCRLFPKERDPLAATALALLVLLGLAPFLGVWEPWEADTAALVEAMRQKGPWLVRVGERVLPELPFGHWPVLGSTALFGVNELGLRLPGLLFGAASVGALVAVVRPLFGRLAAWLAALALLTMPLFAYQTRFALGAGPQMGALALSCLAFLRLGTAADAGRGWGFLAWLGLAVAGLMGGVPAALTPLLTAGALVYARARAGEPVGTTLKALLPPVPVALGVILLGLGWWRAIAAAPEGNSLAALLLWPDRLDGVLEASKRPTFELFTHQLGFGLFPLSAFIPLAFGVLLWRERPEDEAPEASAALPATAAWFAAAFLAPALTLGFSHFGLFLGAPAVALAIGVYFARVLKSPPEPLLALVSVLILALLDSNLKHETHSLADALVGLRVDAFPPEIDGFFVGRLLNLLLLGALLFYQGGAHRVVLPVFRALVYPANKVGWLLNGLAAISLAPAIYVTAKPPDALLPLLSGQGAFAIKAWVRVRPEVRTLLLFLVVWLVTYLALATLWNLRVSLLKGRREGRLTLALRWLLERANEPKIARVVFTSLLVGWLVFQNGYLAHALTLNFSQKDIIQRYQDLAKAGEPLFKYDVDPRSSSFYARDLKALTPVEFSEKAQGASRFFAIVPRDRLADINDQFRKVAKRTLPVLYDASFRFLLVSNQLGAGDEDRNPITRALVKALPAEATPISINFDDQIELVGYALNPKEPRAGSPLTVSLFWRAKKPINGSWKIFVHFDAPGQRIHGDHDPVEGLFPTDNWNPGDLVRDDYNLVVKNTISSDWFTFYTGLYRGNSRMPIKAGAKDNENRAKLGRIRVR